MMPSPSQYHPGTKHYNRFLDRAKDHLPALIYRRSAGSQCARPPMILLIVSIGVLLLHGQSDGRYLESPDARVLGMGKAYTGVASGSAALFWNSAGLCSLEDMAFSGSFKINRRKELEWWSLAYAYPPTQGAGIFGVGYMKYETGSTHEIHLISMPVLFQVEEGVFYGIDIKYFDQRKGPEGDVEGMTFDGTVFTDRFSPLTVGLKFLNLSEPPLSLLSKRYDLGVALRDANWNIAVDFVDIDWEDPGGADIRYGMEFVASGFMFRCGYFEEIVTGHGNITFGFGTGLGAVCILDYAYVRDREDSRYNMHLFSLRLKG